MRLHRFHHLQFLFNRELNELYFSVALRFFALALIGIFIPIHLLKLDYTVTSVLFFYVVWSGAHSAFTIPAARVAARFGFKHTILFSVPFLIAAYILLYTLEIYSWPLWIVAMLFGINNAFFWLGFHVDFAKFSDTKNRGKALGTAEALGSLFYAAGPVSGGLILAFFGFNTLLVVATIALLLSVVPLFFSGDVHEPITFSIKKLFQDQSIRDFLAFVGKGVELWAWGVIWPVFIFFTILNSYTSLGLLASFSLVFTVLAAIAVGKYSDINRRLMLRIGAVLTSVAWMVRFFVTTTLQVFLIEAFYGASQIMAYIPLDALTYDKANQGNRLEYITFREIVIHLGGATFFAVMFFIANFSDNLMVGFGLASIGALLMTLF